MLATDNYWFHQHRWHSYQRQVKMLLQEKFGTKHASLLTHAQYEEVKDEINRIWASLSCPEPPGPSPFIGIGGLKTSTA